MESTARKKLAIHPACAASPGMTTDKYDALKADISEHGLIDPIVLHHGEILDGRHRYKVCGELGIEPEFIHNDDLLEHKGDPWAYVWSSMQHKQPNESQLGFYAVSRAEALKAEAKERQKLSLGRGKKGQDARPDLISGQARDIAGKEFGISGRTIDRARRVITDGCMQLQQAVRDGRVKVFLAEQVVSSIPANKQQEVVAVAMAAKNPRMELQKIVREAGPVKRKKESTNAPRRKQGASLITAASRKAVLAAIKVLERALEQIGFADQCQVELGHIRSMVDEA